jgi:hypothetical protein
LATRQRWSSFKRSRLFSELLAAARGSLPQVVDHVALVLVQAGGERIQQQPERPLS